MQEPIAMPPLGLRSGEKGALRVKILEAEGLTDEQALIATSLLALSNDMGRVSVSMFAATQMFDCSEAEWGETVQSLVNAGLVDAAWAGRRVDLAWRGMNQQRGS